MRWERDELRIDVRERTTPWRSPLRGRILFRPSVLGAASPLAIDGAGAHLWQPIAPLGRVEVKFDDPGCSFRGAGYLDTNGGDEPLEDGFSSWSWTRLAEPQGARITYDVETRDGRSLRHGLSMDDRGSRRFSGRVERTLRPTAFGLRRVVRVGAGDRSSLLRTLEDGPFYARSAVEVVRPDGQTLRGVHETISLGRLASRWVQFLIPFRARREA